MIHFAGCGRVIWSYVEDSLNLKLHFKRRQWLLTDRKQKSERATACLHRKLRSILWAQSARGVSLVPSYHSSSVLLWAMTIWLVLLATIHYFPPLPVLTSLHMSLSSLISLSDDPLLFILHFPFFPLSLPLHPLLVLPSWQNPTLQKGHKRVGDTDPP